MLMRTAELGGGVMIAVHEELGISKVPTPAGASPGRLLASKLEVPGWKTLLIVSVFMRVGVGLDGTSRQILAAIGTAVQEWQGKWLMARDFLMQPQIFMESGWLHRVGGTVKATTRATCITIGSNTVLDYYVVTEHLEAWTNMPQVMCFQSHPHRPVQMLLKHLQQPVYKWELVKFRKLGLEKIPEAWNSPDHKPNRRPVLHRALLPHSTCTHQVLCSQ